MAVCSTSRLFFWIGSLKDHNTLQYKRPTFYSRSSFWQHGGGRQHRGFVRLGSDGQKLSVMLMRRSRRARFASTIGVKHRQPCIGLCQPVLLRIGN